MAKLIRNRKLLEDAFVLVDDTSAIPDSGPVLVSGGRWRRDRLSLLARTDPVGVVLTATDEPAAIEQDLPDIDPVCVHIARFNDGRGYSIARLLRERYGYRGELRATGDVLRDQIWYLSRVGFDAFELRADQDADAALAALDDFCEGYQSSVERPEPLFRRRVAHG